MNKFVSSLLVTSCAASQIFPKKNSQDNLKIQIDSENRIFRDGSGRHTLFHGFNVIYKVPPYIPDEAAFDPQNSLSNEDIADLKNWGVNFVRLGVMWEAVEIAPGVYNTTYLDEA
jgi:endoglycosylceramidase